MFLGILYSYTQQEHIQNSAPAPATSTLVTLSNLDVLHWSSLLKIGFVKDCLTAQKLPGNVSPHERPIIFCMS